MEGTTAGIALSEIRKYFRRGRRSAKKDNGKRGPQAAKWLRHEGLHYDCIQVLFRRTPSLEVCGTEGGCLDGAVSRFQLDRRLAQSIAAGLVVIRRRAPAKYGM